MRATSKQRDEFIADMTRNLPNMSPYSVTRFAGRLMRLGATYCRMQEAQCNGDWPADNGERKTAECKQCGSYWHPSVLKTAAKLCPDCRIQANILAACRENGVTVNFAGDPRGYTVALVFGDRRVGVPTS